MYKLYVFRENDKKSVASLKYTECFNSMSEAEARVNDFECSNYMIIDSTQKADLPLR